MPGLSRGFLKYSVPRLSSLAGVEEIPLLESDIA